VSRACRCRTPEPPGSWRRSLRGSGDIELDPPEAGRFHLAAHLDQLEQNRHAGFGHAEMVDAELRQLGELADMRLERRRIGVDLGVPSGERVDATRERDHVVHAVDLPAPHVEADRAHADAVEPDDLAVGHIGGELRHADPTHAQPGQGVDQVGLIVGLEGPGHDRAADDPQRLGERPVIGQRELGRRVALVGHDRKAAVDDMQVAVEQTTPGRGRDGRPLRVWPTLEHIPSGWNQPDGICPV
jgi:hypothetical protein